MRVFLRICAILLAVTTIATGASYFAFKPHEFKVAVPSSNALDQKVIGQAAEMLRAQRAPVRLELKVTDGTDAALEALEAGQVNLAVVRSDFANRGRAHTVMIMRREVAVLIAPKAGKLQKVTDLPNTTIGVARNSLIDNSLLVPVLDYYGISRERAKYIPMPTNEIASALRQKRIDAVIAVGSVSSKEISEVVTEAALGVKGAIQFIDIEEADAIAKRIPALEATEIDQGAFGGRPPRPAESFNTLGYSIRLVATQAADKDHIAELMRHLYLIRQNLNATITGAGLMEAPDLEEATPFLVHPGVRIYVNGEQRSWFDKYSDYIYLSLFLGSGIGSVAAGMFTWMGGRNSGRDPKVPVQRVEAALDAARDARTAEELDAVEREADEILRSVFGLGAKGQMTGDGIASFNMALGELRSRIAARRSALKAG